MIESKNLVEDEAKLRGLATLLRGKGASLEEAVIISTCNDDERLDRESTETILVSWKLKVQSLCYESPQLDRLLIGVLD